MIAGTQLLGPGLGTGLGVLALKHLPMTEGQVSSITSLGVWAPLLVLIWESAALEQPISDKVFHLSWTTAMDV